MDHDRVIKELLAGMTPKTVAARLRVVFPEIDGRLREGIRHEDIVAALNQNGFDLTLNTFRVNLHRWRKTTQALRPPPMIAQVVPLRAMPAAEPVSSPAEPPARGRPDLDAVLDRARRNDIGEEYLARGRPLFKKSKEEET